MRSTMACRPAARRDAIECRRCRSCRRRRPRTPCRTSTIPARRWPPERRPALWSACVVTSAATSAAGCPIHSATRTTCASDTSGITSRGKRPPGQLPAQRRQQRRENDDAVMTGAPRHDARDHGGTPGGGSASPRKRRSVSEEERVAHGDPLPVGDAGGHDRDTEEAAPDLHAPLRERAAIGRSDEQRGALGRIDDRRRGDDAQPAGLAGSVSQPTAPGRILGAAAASTRNGTSDVASSQRRLGPFVARTSIRSRGSAVEANQPRSPGASASRSSV